MKQKLNLFDFTMIVVGLVIGMGIFRTAATSAKYALNPGIYFTALIATIAIIIFYGVNLMGLKMSAKTQNVLMIIKISMIIMLIAALFVPSIHPAMGNEVIHQSNGYLPWIRSFGLSLIAVSFTYG